MSKPAKKKPSSVRHTRAVQRDRTKRPPSAPPDEHIVARLTELIHPATLRLVGYYQQLGLRERILTLPVMVALVLSLIWRQFSGVSELVRMIRTETLLWVPPLRKLSQQALDQRLRTLPSGLFLRLLHGLLPVFHARWQARQRPVPAVIAWARTHYTRLLACDGSTLDALIRKVGLLRELPTHPLAGRMTALLDLASRLPWKIWYEPDPNASDQRCWPQILAALPAGALLLFDLGYTNFTMFLQLTQAQVTFITRAKVNLACRLETALQRRDTVRDLLVWIGHGADRQQVRLIEVLYYGVWYRYLTNELNPQRLPVEYIVALYGQRWRIEDAYAIVKRLLGLAYFWCGAQNAVELQLWATWLLYAVLVDLTDAVAEALEQPFANVSLEMVYRSLYFFTQAYHRGEATDVVIYLAANAKLLGILKRPRKPARQQQPACAHGP
jgi:hypothetical protein